MYIRLAEHVCDITLEIPMCDSEVLKNPVLVIFTFLRAFYLHPLH